MARIVNRFGTLTGWNNITLNMFGRDIEGIEEISYEDEQEMDVEHGAGPMPQGKIKGKYKAKASITIWFEEATSLLQSAPKGTRIQDFPDSDIVVQYEYNGELYKDIIRDAGWKDNATTVKTGDGKIAKKFTLVPSVIDWNV